MLKERTRGAGTVELTPTMFQILLALADGERHGYGIMREIAARTDSGMRLGPGSLYGSLKRLLEAGLIAESAERPDLDLDDERRRYYRLTEPGWVAAQVEAARLEALVRRARAKRLLPETERAPGEGAG